MSDLLYSERNRLIQDIVVRAFETHTFGATDLRLITSFSLGLNLCTDEALVRMHEERHE
jgi:hypothetical protein